MFASVSRVAVRSASSSKAAFSTAAVRLSKPAKPAAKGPKGPLKASALLAGKPMPGLSVLKDKPDPVALADEEYPAWLWAILDGEVAAKKKEGEFDFLTERKRLRAANRTSIKAANYLKTT